MLKTLRVGVIYVLDGDNGKENGNYYNGLYRVLRGFRDWLTEAVKVFQ